MTKAFATSAELTGAQAPVEAGPITACRKCGSRFFSVKESSVYKTELRADGSLHMIDQADCEIDGVSCWDCFASYSTSDFAEVLP